MRRITPCLWFNGQAKEVAEFYTTTFNNAQIFRTDYYTDAGKEVHGHEAGDVLTVSFEIEGQSFMALNGGPQFAINPSISFIVSRPTIEEVNTLWEKLSDNAKILMPLGAYDFNERYGWLTDKFGVSWQIILAEDASDGGLLTSLMYTGDNYGKAEEAMNHYVSVFPDSSVEYVMRYSAGQEPEIEGNISYGEFTILGQKLTAMESAQQHDFSFNEAVSLMIECETQAELDEYWNGLSAVPEAEICGWLKDKYGVSWQITPAALGEMQQNGTPEQVERVMAAFMKMGKINIAELERVYNKA